MKLEMNVMTLSYTMHSSAFDTVYIRDMCLLLATYSSFVI